MITMNTAPNRPQSAHGASNGRRSSRPDNGLVSNWLESLPPDRSTTNQASVAAAVQLVALNNQQIQNPIEDAVTATTTTAVVTRMDVDDTATSLNRPPRRRGPLIVPLQTSGTTDSMHELVDTDGNIVEAVTETATPLEAAEQLQVINDAVRAQAGEGEEDGGEEGAGSASPSYSGPHGRNRDGSSSGQMILDNNSSVPEMYNIPELSTDRGTDFGGSDCVAMSCGTGSQIGGGGRMSQGHGSPYYSPGDSQRSNNNNSNNSNNNSPAGSINRPITGARHSRNNSHGYPRQSLAVSTSATSIRQPGVAPTRFIQQLQSSRRGRGGRGLHARTLSQDSFGSPASPIRENSPTPGSTGGGSQENNPATTRRGITSPQKRGRKKRAISTIMPDSNNNTVKEEEKDADDSITPSKRRRMSSQGPEAIDTILDSSSVNGVSILKVSVRSTRMISEMAEDDVKVLAPRAYKAWKQLQ